MMASHIFPVSNPTTPSSSSSSSSSSSPWTKTAASSATMLLKSEDDSGAEITRILMPSSFEDDRKNEARAFIPRTLSYTNASNSNLYQQQRRRHVASDNPLFTISAGRRQSFRQDMGRAASDTYTITRLCFKMLRYLGVGYRWITRFLALGCYAFLLFPGFLQVGYQYFYSSQIRRGIVYGDQPRNRLDLYLPKNSDGPKPVVAFVTGGAWIIGNFPQGTISDMVKDASQGISFVFNNITEYGGDPNRIYLMGQSAGAHIAACVLLDQAIREAGGGKISWSVSQIKAYFGLSGGYNFLNLVDYFHSRGLYRSIFLSIMEGEESLRRLSRINGERSKH